MKERFFLMMVTARKRAEINDRLFINFDYTKEIDSSYSGMDTRVVEELLENESIRKRFHLKNFWIYCVQAVMKKSCTYGE